MRMKTGKAVYSQKRPAAIIIKKETISEITFTH